MLREGNLVLAPLEMVCPSQESGYDATLGTLAPFSVNDLFLSYFAGKKPSVMQMRVLSLLKSLN